MMFREDGFVDASSIRCPACGEDDRYKEHPCPEGWMRCEWLVCGNCNIVWETESDFYFVPVSARKNT